MNNLALSLCPLLGRSLLSWGFIASGFAKMLAPAATATYMRSGGLPESSLLAVATGSFEVVCGAALVIGLGTRCVAGLLAAFTLAASLLFHAYWTLPDVQQTQQQLLFTKNLAILGGLLVVTAFGGGPWSLDGHSVRREFKARLGYLPSRPGRRSPMARITSRKASR